MANFTYVDSHAFVYVYIPSVAEKVRESGTKEVRFKNSKKLETINVPHKRGL